MVCLFHGDYGPSDPAFSVSGANRHEWTIDPGLLTEARNVGEAEAISAELFHNGLLATGLALIAVLIYIWFRFEWQFGVGVVVTLILDVTKTIGFFGVTQIQFDLTSVAALLTLIGYSVTDKVVVYDRIRENLAKHRTIPLRQLIGLSINQTLSRTVVTSLTVLLSILPLAIIGGEVMRGFALAIIFGIVVGTSSSIFIASPILLFWGRSGCGPGSLGLRPLRALQRPGNFPFTSDTGAELVPVSSISVARRIRRS